MTLKTNSQILRMAISDHANTLDVNVEKHALFVTRTSYAEIARQQIDRY